MVRNKLCWDANDVVGLPKQRKVGLDWYEFPCIESPAIVIVTMPLELNHINPLIQGSILFFSLQVGKPGKFAT